MRPDRLKLMMVTAQVWAQRSTCSRLHVGCVIHREGRILVQGYNGAPAGLPHCDHRCDCQGQLPKAPGEDHTIWCNSMEPCTRAVHAEQNAIAYAARWGVGLEGASLTVTHQPCASCAMSVINSGITEVTYQHPYRLMDGVHLLLEAGIPTSQFTYPESSQFDMMGK